MKLSERIESDPAVMGGVPCVRGTRIPVATVIRCVGSGMSHEQIIDEYPRLTREDIGACVDFAIALVQDRYLPLRPTGS